MDYKAIEKFVNLMTDLILAINEQTDEIKKFRIDLKNKQSSPNDKDCCSKRKMEPKSSSWKFNKKVDEIGWDKPTTDADWKPG